MFQKILVPLDGSSYSLKALDEASQIAKMSSGKSTLTNVYSAKSIMTSKSELSTRGDIGPLDSTEAGVSRMIERAARNRILQDGEQRIRATGVQVERKLVEGHTVQEIVRLANGGNFDLIVMGARGVSHISKTFLGSVTEGVLHHANCPVLVIK